MQNGLIFISILISFLLAQPAEIMEFQINGITGTIVNSLDQTPARDVFVELISGNGVIKDQVYTDGDGFFEMQPPGGYVWNPKLYLSSSDYLSRNIPIYIYTLDTLGKAHVDIALDPFPDDQKVPDLVRVDMDARALTFLPIGSVFYYVFMDDDGMDAERIVIFSKHASKQPTGFIQLTVNDVEYDPVRCYVTQNDRFENLSAILKGYFPFPIFQNSGLPLYLPDDLMKPNIIFGSVIENSTGEPIPGAEIQIFKLSPQDENLSETQSINTTKDESWTRGKTEPTKESELLTETHEPKLLPLGRRVTGVDGKFAFQVLESGTYKLMVSPPNKYGDQKPLSSDIIVKTNRGGWHKSDYRIGG